MVERVNAAAPDIVWVGLGTPKQERFMASHRQRLDAPVLVGVGAAFDLVAGTLPQAPPWMRAPDASSKSMKGRIMQDPMPIAATRKLTGCTAGRRRSRA